MLVNPILFLFQREGRFNREKGREKPFLFYNYLGIHKGYQGTPPAISQSTSLSPPTGSSGPFRYLKCALNNDRGGSI